MEYRDLIPDRLDGRFISSHIAIREGGAVPATANVAPRILVDIYESFVRGDHAAAKAAQLRLSPIRLSLNLGTPPGGVKAALALMGMSIGPSRSPINPLPPDKQQKMKASLQATGLMT